MLRFPKGGHDDQVDALAYIGLILDKLITPQSEEEEDEEEWAELERTERVVNKWTGY